MQCLAILSNAGHLYDTFTADKVILRILKESKNEKTDFYNACRVNCEDEALMQARISLCLCVKNVLANILTMFRINVPESM